MRNSAVLVRSGSLHAGASARSAAGRAMHRLVPFDRSPSPFCRPKAQARGNPLLNKPVVLIQDVIEVRRGSTARLPAEFSGLL
jgi:hypothetical protein